MMCAGCICSKRTVFIYLLASLVTFAPYFLLGEDSIVTIHDFLDCAIGYMKVYHENGLFFSFDAPTPALSGMSTLFFIFGNFSLQSFAYCFLDTYHAFLLTSVVSTALAFFSFHFLLQQIFPDNAQDVFLDIIALSFSILPNFYGWNIGVATLPMIISIFLILASEDTSYFTSHLFLLFFFPFISSFTIIGLFVLGFWLVGTIVISYQKKGVHVSLVTSLLMLLLGYVVVDLRLFYVMFILKEPLNRQIMKGPAVATLGEQCKIFYQIFKTYLLTGLYHGESLQRPLILRVVAVVSLFYACKSVVVFTKSNTNIRGRFKDVYVSLTPHVKLLFFLEIVLIFFSIVIGLDVSGFLKPIIAVVLPILKGFSFARLFLFNRVIWYVLFALSVYIIITFPKRESFFQKIPYLRLWSNTTKCTAYLLVLLQLPIIMFDGGWCSYPYFSKDNYLLLLDKYGVVSTKAQDNNISYREFYSEELFQTIKKEIDYKKERVVAFGFHPSVLIYNGFYTIDGYNNAYPLSYFKQFRTLIAPELEKNKTARDIYDSWGGRMYLYHDKVSFMPTRKLDTLSYTLHIDMDVFRTTFHGKYIFSRVAFDNVQELGLELVNVYSQSDSIYRIFLYRTKS